MKNYKPTPKFKVVVLERDGRDCLVWQPATKAVQEQYNLKHVLFDLLLKDDTVNLTVEFESVREAEEFPVGLEISAVIDHLLQKDQDYETEFHLMQGGDDDEPFVFGFSTDSYDIDRIQANKMVSDVIDSVYRVFNVHPGSINDLNNMLQEKGYEPADNRHSETSKKSSAKVMTFFVESEETDALQHHNPTEFNL